MSYLYQVLDERVQAWREAGFKHDAYPAIAEILGYAREDDGSLRYLRKAQLQALETYWYLRLVLNTPTIPELYAALFPKVKDRLTAMGVTPKLFEEADYDFDALVERVRTDQSFVRANHLESLRETYTLNYPSYILALAMGAGKTILMGAIAATEFAMAQEYSEGPFVQNALVFAPGKTIIESLREIADIPFDKLLPARMYAPFSATLKLTFTRDGEKELPVVWGSQWNLIVTNTEKIRIQKPTQRKNHAKQMILGLETEAERAEEIANLRLQAVASLPHLAIFSDEAHHTYGQKLLGVWKKNTETGESVFIEQGIKKVRRTVDYLSQETNLVVVINTTGTPYFERQPLRDVVVWYSLGQGIEDGVLKELANNIQIFDLDDDKSDQLVSRIVADFAADYWSVSLEDGSPARLALYFPNTEAMDALRPAVESALVGAGKDAACVLGVHNKVGEDIKREFYRVASDPSSPYRVILLVNMGTEGWNCPSLFACGLVRSLKSSNNFVLQAATRCLRQVPGNTKPARVYVSKGNRSILEKQLVETYATSIDELNRENAERIEEQIEVRKPNLPPIHLKKRILRYRRKEDARAIEKYSLKVPTHIKEPKAAVSTWTLVPNAQGRVQLKRVDGGEDTIEFQSSEYSVYGAASELASNYHLPTGQVLSAIKTAYGSEAAIPEYHMADLGKQLEAQVSHYEEYWEEIDIELALLKLDGFEKQSRKAGPVYTARVSFTKERAHLYKKADDFADAELARDLSFHYEGYNFDSNPEIHYLERVLALLKENPKHIEGIWFTGGLTDPNKTELFAEYLGEDGRWHRYTPDFVIARKDKKCLVVEIKNDALSPAIREDIKRHKEGDKPLTQEGRKAVALKRWEELNPEVLQYEVIFADQQVGEDALDKVRAFVTAT